MAQSALPLPCLLSHLPFPFLRTTNIVSVSIFELWRYKCVVFEFNITTVIAMSEVGDRNYIPLCNLHVALFSLRARQVNVKIAFQRYLSSPL